MGSFDLHAKKAILGNKLVVSLVGVQVTETHRNGKRHTSTREIYRDEVLVEDAREYPAGHTSRHEFQIAAPNIGSRDFMNSALGKVLGTAIELLSNKQTSLRWRVEARLDAKGVDLAASKPVSIRMPV